MPVESASIMIYDRSAERANGVKELMDALGDVARSRSTRDLIRSSKDSKVNCYLRVPLLKEGYQVDSGLLGRALRKVMRAAVQAARPGDQIVVDFLIEPDSRLRIAAGPAAEMGGIDASFLKQLQEG